MLTRMRSNSILFDVDSQPIAEIKIENLLECVVRRSLIVARMVD